MANVNSANDEHVGFRGFYFTADFGSQASIAGINLIESSGMRLAELGGIHAVVGGDRSVDAECRRVTFAGQIRLPERATYAFDPNVGNVGWFSHAIPLA